MNSVLSWFASQDWSAWVNVFWTVVGAVSSLLVAVIAVAQRIPGDEPEKTLQKVVDWIAKYSKKPEVK